MWNLDFSFCTVDASFAEGNGKTHGGVEQLVIVGEVVDITNKIIDAQFELLKEAFRQSNFVVISMRGLDWEPQDFGIQGDHLARTGEQNVLKRRRLKNPVIRRMKNQIRRMKITRRPQARAKGALVQQQLIVIPAQPSGNRPLPNANEILNESGLLDVWTSIGEVESRRRARVESSKVGDQIAKALTQKRGV